MNDGVVKSVTVDMGEPVLKPDEVPVASVDEKIRLSQPFALEDKIFDITGVSMGNPHGVIFVDEINDNLVSGYGPKLEVASIFPQKANIEFAKIKSRSEIEMRVWERGSGETFACGTGACATAVAAVLNDLADREVDIKLRGGDLHIKWDPETNHVFMTGPAQFICDGEFYLD